MSHYIICIINTHVERKENIGDNLKEHFLAKARKMVLKAH